MSKRALDYGGEAAAVQCVLSSPPPVVIPSEFGDVSHLEDPKVKTTRILALIATVNVEWFIFQLVGMAPVQAQDASGMLRGTGFELVDSQGRVRVQMKVEPGDPNYGMPDGSVGYGETVIFRLITADGKPRVKLTTSEDGSGLMLLGDSDSTYTILQADGPDSTLKLLNKDGSQQVVRP
jgi:hypothetical protein